MRRVVRVPLEALLCVVVLTGAVSHASRTSCEAVPPVVVHCRGGGWFAGLHPLGYKATPLALQWLEMEDFRETDLGQLLNSMKVRRSYSALKKQWVETTRFSRTAQASRIMRKLSEYLDMLLKANLVA